MTSNPFDMVHVALLGMEESRVFMKRMSTKAKFRIGAALISILVCTFVAGAVYMILKDFATDQIYGSPGNSHTLKQSGPLILHCS